MAKVFGRATLKANGRLLDSNKGATLDVGGVKRSPKVTANRVAGYMEEIVPAVVECAVPLTADVSLTELQALADITVVFETDVGKVFTIPHAFLTDPPKTGDQDGDVSLVFNGEPAVES